MTDLVGDKIVAIYRGRYMVRGKEHAPDGISPQGWLELSMQRLGPVRFDSGGDGETLNVKLDSWDDPFKEPLSAENRAYVLEVGKWTRIDVTNELPYADLPGEVLGVDPEFNARAVQVAFTLTGERVVM